MFLWQVRKYLLMLDSRKDHVKFWRPQVLLLVSNPRTCTPLMEFINDVKKGGLYIVGHVNIGTLDSHQGDPAQTDYPQWLNLVDYLKIKAFVEVTLAPTVREGMHHLVRISGLGGMKPNTLCLGFYDRALPEDLLAQRHSSPRPRKRVRFYGVEENPEIFYSKFPALRQLEMEKHLCPEEYVMIVMDALKMNKNLCLCRHFHLLNKEAIVRSKKQQFIDVWPVNFFWPDSSSCYDNTCLFMLQLACILNMVPSWRSRTTLRIFLCVNAQSDDTLRKERKLDQLLQQLRIMAQIKIITWENLVNQLDEQPSSTNGEALPHPQGAVFPLEIPEDYVQGVNELVRLHCESTALTFLYLPKPPADTKHHLHYLSQIEILSNDLPPTVLVNGMHPVTSITL